MSRCLSPRLLQAKRRGFSLMEVMLATSILLGSSIALVELATIGRKQANSAYELNTAQLLCQARLDEIVAGITPVKSVEDHELEEAPGWFYAIEVQPMRLYQLVEVKVSVYQEAREHQKEIRFSLVRWLPDAPSESHEDSQSATTLSASPPPRDNPDEGNAASRRRFPRREDAP